MIGITVMTVIIVLLLIIGIITVTYVIAGHHDLAKRAMAAISYILYFMVSFFVGGLISNATIPPVAEYPTTTEVVKLSVWSLIAFIIIGLIFGFVFHKLWEMKDHNVSYPKKFIKGLNITYLIDIIVFSLTIVYSITEHDIIWIDVIALLATVIAVILGFVFFFMVVKTLKLRWYLYGLSLQGLFIILVLIGFSESCM